jgi:hypothetical protein
MRSVRSGNLDRYRSGNEGRGEDKEGPGAGGRIYRKPPTILSVPSAFFRNRVRKYAGQELAPAFALTANRLLWRRRARPSATLDKMRTKLSMVKVYPPAIRGVKSKPSALSDFGSVRVRIKHSANHPRGIHGTKSNPGPEPCLDAPESKGAAPMGPRKPIGKPRLDPPQHVPGAALGPDRDPRSPFS